MKARDLILLSNKDLHAVKGYFDPFLHFIIAPNQLLCGFAKGLIEMIFAIERSRTSNGYSLCPFPLSEDSGLWNPNCTLQHKNQEALSISTVYAVIALLPFLLKSFSRQQNIVILNTLQKFSTLVAHNFWGPSKETDGVEAVKYVPQA